MRRKKGEVALSPSLSLAVAVAAGAVFAVARIADANGLERAVHPVAVVSAFGDAAGDAAVDVVHIPPPYRGSVGNFCRIYPNRIDKNLFYGYNGVIKGGIYE